MPDDRMAPLRAPLDQDTELSERFTSATSTEEALRIAAEAGVMCSSPMATITSGRLI